MSRNFVAASIVGLLLAACNSPVCRPGLTEQAGRCVTDQVIAVQCEPACSSTAHQVCDGDTDAPTCVCAPGYSGIPCTWTGVLDDPGFTEQDAWTLSGGANVRENATGLIDRGFAFLESSAACAAGTVSQTVEMPSYEVAEPLVAEVTYRARGLFGVAVGFDRAQTFLGNTIDDEWRTERICLGEAAYGGEVRVGVGSTEEHPSCFAEPEGEIEVDRLDILVADAGECPAPGEALNGSGEVGGGGWQFATENGGIAELAVGVGRAASPGVQLVSSASARAVAWTKLSVPVQESLESPALRFWWRGTTERSFQFQIGRFSGIQEAAFPLDDVYGNNSDVNHVYCLPPWTHGNVVDLIFKSLADPSVEDPSELFIDDVEIVSDSRCGTSSDVLDPGFDAGPTEVTGVFHVTQFQDATLRTEPSLSRTGDGGVLELSYWNEAAVLYFETWVLVPESNGDDGPALRYWANVPRVNTKPIRTALGRAARDPADLLAGGGWLQRPPICLPPQWVGRWFRVQWRLGEIALSGTAPVDPPIRIYIDDLEVTTDSACPAEVD